MFYFGRPEDTAQVYWENVVRESGPGMPEGHYDEMSIEELKIAFTYLYGAYRAAIDDGLDEDVVKYMMAQYDELFEILAIASDEFKEIVKNGRHMYLGGYTKENIAKYKKLAGVV